MPAVPALQLALVDVRDVAKAHILAMSNEKTDGQRILVTAQPSFWFLDIAKILAKEFRSQGFCFTLCTSPFQAIGFRNSKCLIQSFGYIRGGILRHEKHYPDAIEKSCSITQKLVENFFATILIKAKELLHIEFTNPEKSVIDMAYSMIERGLLPKRSGYKPRQDPIEDGHSHKSQL